MKALTWLPLTIYRAVLAQLATVADDTRAAWRIYRCDMRDRHDWSDLVQEDTLSHRVVARYCRRPDCDARRVVECERWVTPRGAVAAQQRRAQ